MRCQRERRKCMLPTLIWKHSCIPPFPDRLRRNIHLCNMLMELIPFYLTIEKGSSYSIPSTILDVHVFFVVCMICSWWEMFLFFWHPLKIFVNLVSIILIYQAHCACLISFLSFYSVNPTKVVDEDTKISHIWTDSIARINT